MEDKGGVSHNGRTSCRATVCHSAITLTAAQADVATECSTTMGDYMECLHHTGEIARTKRVKYEMLRREHEQGITPKTKAEMLKEVPKLNIIK